MYLFVLLGGAMSVYFLTAAMKRPGPAEFLAVTLWAAYTVYEYHVANGTLCDANCNIRVDLVLFLPILGGASYLALQREPRIGAVAVLYVLCLGLFAWLAFVFGYRAAAAIAGVGAFLAAAYGIKATISGRRR